MFLGRSKCLTFWAHCAYTLAEVIQENAQMGAQSGTPLCTRLQVRQRSLGGVRELAVVGVHGERRDVLGGGAAGAGNAAPGQSEFERIQVNVPPLPNYETLPFSMEVVYQPEQTLLGLYNTYADWNKLTSFEMLLSIDDVQLQDMECGMPSKIFSKLDPGLLPTQKPFEFPTTEENIRPLSSPTFSNTQLESTGIFDRINVATTEAAVAVAFFSRVIIIGILTVTIGILGVLALWLSQFLPCFKNRNRLFSFNSKKPPPRPQRTQTPPRLWEQPEIDIDPTMDMDMVVLDQFPMGDNLVFLPQVPITEEPPLQAWMNGNGNGHGYGNGYPVMPMNGNGYGDIQAAAPLKYIFPDDESAEFSPSPTIWAHPRPNYASTLFFIVFFHHFSFIISSLTNVLKPVNSFMPAPCAYQNVIE